MGVGIDDEMHISLRVEGVLHVAVFRNKGTLTGICRMDARMMGDAPMNNFSMIIFEFSRFHSTEYEHGAQFVADLDRFFGQLPTGWPYGMELRNKHWLKSEYFACLARHGNSLHPFCAESNAECLSS
jgi:hypothetical protein